MSSAIKIKSPRSANKKSHNNRKKDDKTRSHLWGATYDKEMKENWLVIQSNVASTSGINSECVPPDEIIHINDSNVNPFITQTIFNSPVYQNKYVTISFKIKILSFLNNFNSIPVISIQTHLIQ